MPRQFIHLDSRALSYFDSAPTDRLSRVALLIHAFPLGAAMWEGQLDAMPSGWRLIAPDMRGFGGSSLADPDPSPAIDDYAADVVDLLRALGVETAVVGGLSMGGYVTFALLRRAPHVASGVLLADTRASADTPEGRANRRSMLALLDREGPSGIARDMMPRLLGKTSFEERHDVEPFVRRLIKQQSSRAIRGAVLRMMERPDSFDVLKGLRAPTLFIVGEEDTLTPVDDTRRMVDARGEAELAVIPRAGHLANLEQRQPFNDAVRRFLSQL